MERVEKLIQQYSKWDCLTEYTSRILLYKEEPFGRIIENCKALLESIGKEICSTNNINLGDTPSVNKVIKKAFESIGYPNNALVAKMSGALATIGQGMGEFRNTFGMTVHGYSLEELRERNQEVDELTRQFLVDTTASVACFLIQAFELQVPITTSNQEKNIVGYTDNGNFNETWDGLYGDFNMGDYCYTASEILFHLDKEAYKYEMSLFNGKIENTLEDEVSETEVVYE